MSKNVLFLLALLTCTVTLSSASAQLLPRDRLPEQLEAQVDSLAALVVAKDDTLAKVLYVLEGERLNHALALDMCEERADSLQVDLGWSERWRADFQGHAHRSAFLEAVSSPPVVFIAGALLGGWLTVQVMDAVN
jgi:hypothetical protein